MRRSIMVAGVVLLGLGGPVLAQESGGLGLDPAVKDGPHGLARPMLFTRPPFLTAHDVQNGMTAADHQAQNQAAISQLRGDPGFLSGFSFGTPLAASRQVAVGNDGGYWYRHRNDHARAPVIINNEGPLAVTVGNGNVVQQQSATGSGPIGQQQVATTPVAGSRGGGAVNLVTGGGNIVQRTPGGS